MKADHAKRIYNAARDEYSRDWDHMSPFEQRSMLLLLRAGEQHGIERAKTGVRFAYEEDHAEGPSDKVIGVDWSALDAEVAKENEGG